MEYTFENWKKLKPEALTNAQIAEAIGTSENNVKVQLRPSKKLPTWARAMMFVWISVENYARESIGMPTVAGTIPERPITKPRKAVAFSDTIAPKAEHEPQSEAKYLATAPCGCMMQGKLFLRKKGCKVSREQHKFI